jgi:hypothetical protein
MFPAGAFGVGVTIAALHPDVPEAPLPAGVVDRPSRLGELLPVSQMTPEQKAANLQLVTEAEGRLAAFKAELAVGWPLTGPPPTIAGPGSRGRRRGSGPPSRWTSRCPSSFRTSWR